MSAQQKGAENKEVKVFATGVDTDTLISTVLMQPSLYMGFANIVLMILSQRFPEEFLPQHLLNRRYNGIRLYRMVSIPFCGATMFYFAAASGASGDNPIGGHLGGFVTSMTLAGGFFAARKVSFYYPLLGMMYLTFGSFHHYRKMKLFGNNAPIYQWGDATNIWNDWRAKRAQAKAERNERRKFLAASK